MSKERDMRIAEAVRDAVKNSARSEYNKYACADEVIFDNIDLPSILAAITPDPVSGPWKCVEYEDGCWCLTNAGEPKKAWAMPKESATEIASLLNAVRPEPVDVPEGCDWIALNKAAESIVRQKPTWKRFIDGTPLSNDIAVWMADFATEAIGLSKSIEEWNKRAMLVAADAEPVGVPEGWKLVPVEPTKEMITAACDAEHLPIPMCRRMESVYRAMLAAAPKLFGKAEQVPDGWKHDCAALLANDVELWIDACPHCGKPRPAAPKVEQPCDMGPLCIGCTPRAEDGTCPGAPKAEQAPTDELLYDALCDAMQIALAEDDNAPPAPTFEEFMTDADAESGRIFLWNFASALLARMKGGV